MLWREFVQTETIRAPQLSPGVPARHERMMVAAPAPQTPAEEEIHCYIALRDLLLDSVNKDPTAENLSRLAVANDSVTTCLQPLRSPYQAQYLSEPEAARERERCVGVAIRIAQLRRQSTAPN
ncbi:MAG: hypothetical protein JO354_06370 [Verrucomicrobia bacterium]|nr:hypothetical protein [Verrucomicrobiota bacterium]